MARDLGQPVQPKNPDYFGGPAKPEKADWKKHEKDIAKRSGAKRVAGSGNQPGKPGDIRGNKFLREAKATKKDSISLRGKWLRKITEEALAVGRTPLVEVRLEDAQFPCPTDWVLIPAMDFQALVEQDGA